MSLSIKIGLQFLKPFVREQKSASEIMGEGLWYGMTSPLLSLSVKIKIKCIFATFSAKLLF
jgi:hypothetical protein